MKTKYRLIRTYDNKFQIQVKLFHLYWKTLIDGNGDNLQTDDLANAKQVVIELRREEDEMQKQKKFKAPVIY